jgi:phosphate starvation-inducible protein PhoH
MSRKKISSDKPRELNVNLEELEVDEKSKRILYVPQRSKIDFDLNIQSNVPFTDNQKKFIELANDPKVSCLIVEGPAGCAKSFTAVYCALKRLQEKKSSDLIYIRSLIQSKDGETGFLSGDLESKLYYYNLPMFGKLSEFLTEDEIKKLHKDNRIKTYPTSLIRGNSWNAQDIIADEMQNALFSSLVTILTRVGKYSKCYILADSSQNDYGEKSGFKQFFNIFDDDESKEHGIHTIRFTSDDIVRSGLVQYVVEKIERYNK